MRLFRALTWEDAITVALAALMVWVWIVLMFVLTEQR